MNVLDHHVTLMVFVLILRVPSNAHANLDTLGMVSFVSVSIVIIISDALEIDYVEGRVNHI